MAYGFKVLVTGNYALFTRPELKVERYTYDAMTPSAARGILEAICWKPAIRYVIDKIHVLNPIKVTNIRRNEIAGKASANLARSAMNGSGPPLYIASATNIQQRASLVLQDVAYLIEAHFELTDKAGEQDSCEKFYNIILRRLRKGQCYHQPYLGCREFPARFQLFEEEDITSFYAGEERDLGIMLYDMDYSDPEHIVPTFFRARMQGGVIDLRGCEVMK